VALAPFAAKTTWEFEVQTQVPSCAFERMRDSAGDRTILGGQGPTLLEI